jgi:hypothetical protein
MENGGGSMTLAARLLLGGVLAAVLGACGPAAPSPSPTIAATEAPTSVPASTVAATPSPVPTVVPTPTAVAGATPCGTADLKASHGLVEGAAGSIITEVVLVADTSCTVETSASLGLQDNSGTTLVTATPAGPGSIELVAGAAYTANVRIANWCKPEPAFPVSLLLWIDDEKLIVSGGSFPQDGMPGCIGTDGVHLEDTPWVASP